MPLNLALPTSEQGTLCKSNDTLLVLVWNTKGLAFGLASIEYFVGHFKPLLTYSELRTGVYQSFREAGNLFLFVVGVESGLRSLSFQNSRVLSGAIWSSGNDRPTL